MFLDKQLPCMCGPPKSTFNKLAVETIKVTFGVLGQGTVKHAQKETAPSSTASARPPHVRTSLAEIPKRTMRGTMHADMQG